MPPPGSALVVFSRLSWALPREGLRLSPCLLEQDAEGCHEIPVADQHVAQTLLTRDGIAQRDHGLFLVADHELHWNLVAEADLHAPIDENPQTILVGEH